MFSGDVQPVRLCFENALAGAVIDQFGTDVSLVPVDGIRYNEKGEANLYINQVEVVLGDSSRMDGKISLLADMMPQIQNLEGTLYLDNYDENKEDLVSTFKKKNTD